MSELDVLSVVGGEDSIRSEAKRARDLAGLELLSRTLPALQPSLSSEDREQWERMLDAVEWTALDMAPDVAVSADVDSRLRFQRFCSQAFDFRRALGTAGEHLDRVKNLVRLACVALLAGRADDLRRDMSGWEPWPIPESATDDTWAHRLFARTADAFLRLVRKQGWGDLDRVAEFIRGLREDQRQFEAGYLEQHNGVRQTAAFELISFYHLAKAVETAGTFTGTGQPLDGWDETDLHIRHAIETADLAGIAEWAVLLRWLQAALRRLIENTLWHQMRGYNHRVTELKKLLTSRESPRPLFELLPPQQDAVHDVMNTALRALVVQMPTSSGKTLLAEFRILQAKINVPDGWIAYLVPTRALVNQITNRLRRDLDVPELRIRVELASPAEAIDAFEEQLLHTADGFDVLVTTPEKLDLIIRGGEISLTERPLSLVVFDEAQHLGDASRGMRAETLLTTLNVKSPETAFLLLTPFIKNAKQVAEWLEANPSRSKAVHPVLAADWKPNDLLVGMAWPEGRGRQWRIDFETLHTSRETIEAENVVAFERVPEQEKTKSEVGNHDLAAELAKTLSARGSTLTMVLAPDNAWSVAEQIAGSRSIAATSEKRSLVKRFLAVEYGTTFPLCDYLDKRLGVHHAGLSDETRYLMEWLMEEGELDHLVATSTLAQGVNFDLSNVVLSSLSVKQGSYARDMSFDEFWNVAGRAGRIGQMPVGVVAIAAPKVAQRPKARLFVENRVAELVAVMEGMIETLKLYGGNIAGLARNDAKWSAFAQYLSHCYRQLGKREAFSAETDKILHRMYSFRRLQAKSPPDAKFLLDAVKEYGGKLERYGPGCLSLVDQTGFSPETVLDLLSHKSDFPRSFDDWSPSQLFRTDGGLRDIVGRLLEIKEMAWEKYVGEGHKYCTDLLSAWIEGRSLSELASLVPREEGSTEAEHLTSVVRFVTRSLTRGTSWGMSAVQRLAGIDAEELSPDQRRVFRSLPGMIYYGCKTPDGVLMRSQGVPRGVCEGLGKAYREETGRPANEIAAARNWLSRQPNAVWEKARTRGQNLAGMDYRSVWRIVNGKPLE